MILKIKFPKFSKERRGKTENSDEWWFESWCVMAKKMYRITCTWQFGKSMFFNWIYSLNANGLDFMFSTQINGWPISDQNRKFHVDFQFSILQINFYISAQRFNYPQLNLACKCFRTRKTSEMRKISLLVCTLNSYYTDLNRKMWAKNQRANNLYLRDALFALHNHCT